MSITYIVNGSERFQGVELIYSHWNLNHSIIHRVTNWTSNVYIEQHDDYMYSGTSLIRTPLGQDKLS